MNDLVSSELTFEDQAGVGDLPAVLGGTPTFPAGQPFMRPSLPGWEQLAQPVSEMVSSGMLTKGQYLDAFEERVARYLGVRQAIAVSSCTVGLMLLYQSLGLEGEVLVPSFTFMATVHPLVWQGVTPVFIDIDPQTWNVDPGRIEAHISPHTTAIVAVHVFGNPAAVEELERITRKRGLALIFDAAHGFGALHRAAPVGGHGVAEVFSTSPTKLLVTGEGGVVATNDEKLAREIRIAREYGNPGTYDSVVAGLNARMQEFSAILGLHSLEMLEENARRRNELVARYRRSLQGVPGVGFQLIRPYNRSSFKDFTIQLDPRQFGMARDTLQTALAQEGIGTRTYYVPPVHQQSAYRQLLQKRPPHLPVTTSVAQTVLSLPIYSHMLPTCVDAICRAIGRIQRHAPQIQAVLKEAPEEATNGGA